jgi:hypothetical protein
MRSDMKKVVVERPRWGSRLRNRKFGAKLRYVPDHDYDEQPKKARGFESYEHGGKRFTDVLGPLYRYLDKNVGRPWDKVYSEMCASLDKRKVTGQHIFDHLKHMVERECHVGDDGKVRYNQYRHGYFGQQPEQEVSGYYVHPRTGLLCLAKRRETYRQERRRELMAREITWLRLDQNTAYHLHEGIWYKVKLVRMVVSFNSNNTQVYDVFLKRKVQLGWGENWVPIEKKQCNRRELVEVRRLLEGRQKEAPPSALQIALNPGW